MKGRQSGMPGEETWSSFFDADCLLKRLSLEASCREVVEFGCGYGLFTLAAARVASGSVLALDIEQALVDLTNLKAKAQGLTNVEARVRDFIAEGTGIEGASCDYAMLFNILHVEEPVSLLREAHRVLRPGAKAGVIHWKYDMKTPRGPSLDIRPKPSQMIAWAQAAGFQIDLNEDLPCCPYHYGVVLTKLGP